MAILEILEYPADVLKQVSEPVEVVNEEIKQLVKDMFETMYHDKGAGLAANQIGVAKRVITMDVSSNRSKPICIINPEIVKTKGKVVMEEGCLSFPGLYLPFERAEEITVKALDQDGEPFQFDADGWLARCVQHEMDHINGIVFVDRLSGLKRSRALKKLAKLKRMHRM